MYKYFVVVFILKVQCPVYTTGCSFKIILPEIYID